MSDRVSCCVPFCRRSWARGRLKGANEAICTDHFRLADAALRQRFSRVKRRHTMAARRCDPASLDRADRLANIYNWLWQKCRRQAEQRAMGI